jgi:hypothetical protein
MKIEKENWIMKKCKNPICDNIFRTRKNNKDGQIYCSKGCYKFCELLQF